MSSEKIFALVDCNNFYASCEKIFQPDLNDKPVVILLNNDGCIIARSNEAKDLKIPMGAAYHQYRQMIEKNHVKAFSSNYTFDIEFPVTTDCFTKNGIGYNLGFYNTQPNESTFSNPPYTLTPDTRPDVVQDRYVYITINDWYQVHHQYPDQSELSAFIKVPLTAPKFTVQYDNISLDSDVKEYFFPQPQNIQKLEISVLDSYGALLNMQGGSFSMSFVVNEILQSSIYEKMLQL
jgi:hypothetical protein